MGLWGQELDFIETSARRTIGELRGKRMLELGNQQFLPEERRAEKTGKQYYERLGVRHVSFDLNGEDGSYKIDLSKPITDPLWLGSFDIVTNLGTTEHVEPHDAQYECFMNIHECLRPGGIAVHVVPSIEGLEEHGYWKDHCNNYYSRRFFAYLAESGGYETVAMELDKGLIFACLRKRAQTPFLPERGELLSRIVRRSGGMVYAGINDRTLGAKITLARQRLRPLWGLVADILRPLRRRLARRGPPSP